MVSAGASEPESTLQLMLLGKTIFVKAQFAPSLERSEAAPLVA